MKKRGMAVIGMMIVCFVMMGSAAYCFDSAHIEQLKKTKNCPKCDLSSANLSGVGRNYYSYLRGADLSSANLQNADLSSADMQYANLSGANLSNANLKNSFLFSANLSNANLSGADMTGATGTEGWVCKAGSIGKCIICYQESRGFCFDGI